MLISCADIAEQAQSEITAAVTAASILNVFLVDLAVPKTITRICYISLVHLIFPLTARSATTSIISYAILVIPVVGFPV